MQKPRLLDIRKIQKRVGVFCLLAFAGIMFHTQAQTIKGDVYGGGNVGNLGEDGQEASPVVTISGGTTVRTVFGGGLNGTVSGSTTVNILGGTVGAAEYSGTATGGVYGGGEGSTATVSGDATVYIAGGEVVNNVYGGGKMAALNGNATVEIAGGRMKSDVYAGARAADINGFAYAYVHFRSLVRSLFGGNDIGGEIRNANKASGDCPAYYSGVLQKAKQMPLAFIRIASGDAPASGDALTASYPQKLRDAVDQHYRVYEALCSHDVEGTKLRMREHLQDVYEEHPI